VRGSFLKGKGILLGLKNSRGNIDDRDPESSPETYLGPASFPRSNEKVEG
jgi:hypothetical protein